MIEKTVIVMESFSDLFTFSGLILCGHIIITSNLYKNTCTLHSHKVLKIKTLLHVACKILCYNLILAYIIHFTSRFILTFILFIIFCQCFSIMPNIIINTLWDINEIWLVHLKHLTTFIMLNSHNLILLKCTSE